MSIASHRKRTVETMQSLGVYKSEFDSIIEIYAGLMDQYDVCIRAHRKDKYSATVKTATDDGGVKGNPLVKQLEVLRKDILSYSDRLCLNPKAHMGADVPDITAKSPLSLIAGGTNG